MYPMHRSLWWFFLQKRWDVLLIVTGGIVLFRGAAISDGVGFVPQLFGFLLSLEFFLYRVCDHSRNDEHARIVDGHALHALAAFFEICVAH